MRLLVTTDNRFLRLPDGTVWAPAQGPYTYWKTFLDVFDEVHFIARVRDVESVGSTLKRADGPGVKCAAVPDFHGPGEYVRRIWQVNQQVKGYLDFQSAVIMRVPSTLGTIAYSKLKTRHFPYGVNVVTDPWLVFGPTGVRHPLRAYFRQKFVNDLKEQCWNAAAGWYVTRENLQKNYPTKGYCVGVSDVQIKGDFISEQPRKFADSQRKKVLIFVGSLAQMYKAPDILIDAFAQCIRQDLNLDLIILGDGQHRPELEERARNLGVENRVHFLGLLPGTGSVREKLDEADLFVLPSRSEGLPRAMVEAMARGLPVIGTPVGGVPELLDEESMVEPDNVAALAEKIRQFVTNPDLMREKSERNLEIAHEFEETGLRQKRIEFLQHVKTATQEWLKQHAGTR